MKVPYKKDNLHSTIDWEKFFAIQTSNFTRGVNKKDVKTKVKTKANMTRKGGRRK